jgi:hypothetical protein
MSGRIVIDIDVLIDYYRDHEAVMPYLEACTQPVAFSEISMSELDVGVRDRSPISSSG